MKFSHLLAILVLIALSVLLYSSSYVVSEQEQALITRFGQPVGAPIIEAGMWGEHGDATGVHKCLQ